MDETNCDREPIHVPGSIQPHGLLLVLDRKSEIVKQFAGDPTAFFGAHCNALGMSATDLFGASVKSLTAAQLSEAAGPVPLDNGRWGRTDLHATAQRAGDALIVEIEAAPENGYRSASLLWQMSLDATAIQQAGELRDACEVAAASIARQVGFDRVMVYQFLPDGSGKVIAECLSGSLGSFLNQHFPASDIPAQARALYQRNLIRVIPDVSYTPSPLVPSDSEGAPLDMSDCTLRSVSPLHVQYLKNMEVGASLSVSLIQDGALWGLIACHHPTPQLVSYEAREACKQLGILLSLQLQHLSAFRHAQKVDRLASSRDALISLLSRLGVQDELPKRLPHAAHLIDSDGFIFSSGDRLAIVGSAPSPERCRELLEWIKSRQAEKVFASECLSEQFPPAADYAELLCGVLAVRVEDAERIDLVWLRREFAHEVLWAGNPHKNAAEAGDLTPRKSFDVWREEVRGRSLPWEQMDKATATHFGERLEAICARQRMVALQSELIFVSRLSAMGAMAATLAHELNQPLTAISNYASGVSRALASQQDQSALVKAGVDAIETNALRAGGIIRSLREMIRRGDVNHVPRDLEPIVDQAVKLVRAGEARCGTATIRCSFEHQRRILGDSVQIQQVIVNLLRNACDATPSGELPRIEIGTRDADDHILVRVKDYGGGIPEKHVERLFEAFSSTKEEGLGVGLSICRTIVEAHGGKIEGSNHPQGGAVFSFTIPAERVH
jgi:light-regulated signal transduction histidine kinase (bacteriophytochrome)